MDPDSKFRTLLAVAAADVVLLTCLSSRRGRISRAKHGRFFLWAASALYLPLISYILTYLTNDISTLVHRSCIQDGDSTTELQKTTQELECLSRWAWAVMLTVIVLQSLKSNADMAALAVAAVASPAAGADDIDSQRIRPSMDSLIYSFWVASVVIYTMLVYAHKERHLIDGYMAQLQEMEAVLVPPLIVTGEKNEDVEETLQGYRVKPSALISSRLVTLDKVWTFASPFLFKCLRRRFAGYRLAEAGSTRAFHFVCHGLLGEEDDHGRIFRVIAHELSFASDFYYSPLPVASLVGIHLILLTAVAASLEIWALVSSARSNWTKISMVAHCINRPRWHWKDVIGQSRLLKPSPPKDHLFKQIFFPRRNQHVKVTSDVKAAVLTSLRISERQLSNGIATVQRRCPHLAWACHGGATTNTDAILVWHIATSLFECSLVAAPAPKPITNMAVANSLSCYCAYLVAEAPDLLPDNAASMRLRYRQVKECVETSMRSASSRSGMALYSHLLQSFGHDNSHEVLKRGSRLGRQLVEEVQRRKEENQEKNHEQSSGGEEEAVWELLAEFWSEMILYLAPSDNVKGHVEALQRGGELITLLWALLLHASITTRPAPTVPEP
ncbi:hypothetical protein VPH35_042032 [Triticum aestivum]